MKNDPASRFRLRGAERLKKLAELTQRLRGTKRSRILSFFGVRRSVGLAMLAALLALRILDPAPLEDLRLRSFDFYQILKPRIPTLKPVVIVDIDEESLRTLGQWPWPRTLVADLVEKLKGLGAVAIAFDILFPEQDRMSPISRHRLSAISTRRPRQNCKSCRATTTCWPPPSKARA